MFDFATGWLAGFFRKPAPEPPIQVLMNGLDAAGKTSILYALSHHRDGAIQDVMPHRHCPVNDYYTKRVTCEIPTIGMQVERMKSPWTRLEVVCWDVGGPDKIRSLWRHYYKGTDAIVFVIDSSDRDRVDDVRREMKHILSEKLLEGIPLLVLANKRDLPNAIPLSEMRELLDLDRIEDRRWRLYGICAGPRTEIGIHEGFEWIAAGCPSLVEPMYDIQLLRSLYVCNRASVIPKGAADTKRIMQFLCDQPPEICQNVASFLGNRDQRVSPELSEMIAL